MFKTAKPARDAFTLSLGGLTAIASFVAAPAVANDRINQAWDQRLSQARDERHNPVRNQHDSECCAEPA